jgi:hypothetical protein
MKRISTVGLSVVAMFAFSAMAASSALAGEYITCVKVAKENKKFHGKYTGNNCAVLSATSEGKYERGSPAFPVTFTTKSKMVQLSSAAGSVNCKESAGKGAILGPKMSLEERTLTECLHPIGGKCTNLSTYLETHKYAPSKITLVSLSELVDHGENGPSGLEPAEGEVWDSLSADAESTLYPYQAVFICEPGIILRMGGSTSGVVAPVNLKKSNKGTLTFGREEGEQDLVTEFSENGGETWESTGPNVLMEAASIKYSSHLEVTSFAP